MQPPRPCPPPPPRHSPRRRNPCVWLREFPSFTSILWDGQDCIFSPASARGVTRHRVMRQVGCGNPALSLLLSHFAMSALCVGGWHFALVNVGYLGNGVATELRIRFRTTATRRGGRAAARAGVVSCPPCDPPGVPVDTGGGYREKP